MKKHLPWLDALRAVAMLAVLVGHYRNALFPAFNDLSDVNILARLLYSMTRWGHQAVIVFFVLSGFLVGGTTIRQIRKGEFSLKAFSISRLFRIGIPLAVAGAFLWSLNLAGIPVPGLNVLGNVLCLQGLFCEPALGPWWALSVEVWFYVLVGSVGVMFWGMHFTAGASAHPCECLEERRCFACADLAKTDVSRTLAGPSGGLRPCALRIASDSAAHSVPRIRGTTRSVFAKLCSFDSVDNSRGDMICLLRGSVVPEASQAKPRPISKCRGGIPPVDDILNRSQFCERLRLRFNPFSNLRHYLFVTRGWRRAVGGLVAVLAIAAFAYTSLSNLVVFVLATIAAFRLPVSRSRCRLLLAVAFSGVTMVVNGHLSYGIDDVLLGAALCFLVREAILWEPTGVIGRVVERVGQKIAPFSYSAYLVHMIVMVLLMNGVFTVSPNCNMCDVAYFGHIGRAMFAPFQGVTAQTLALYLASVGLALVVSYLFYLIAEKPAARLVTCFRRCPR